MFNPSNFVQPPPPYPPFRNPPPTPFAGPHPPTTHPICPLDSRLNQRKIDGDFFNNFINRTSRKSQQRSSKKYLGISETHELISSINSLIITLEDATDYLQKTGNSGENWEADLSRCRCLKLEIETLMEKLRTTENICGLKRLIDRRRRKRLREKRRRGERKLEKSRREERRAKISNDIDHWIRSKREVIDREKSEENLKKDADLVLGDVRGKRSDAKRYLNILKELKSLRKVKSANARARGENLSTAADESFERIIQGLIAQWSQLDREYRLEEQGLKLMLKSDEERGSHKQKLRSFADWEVAIFGKPLASLRSASVQQLVMTRFAWDRFISWEGGRIPMGWIMPTTPSSAAWQKCLKN